MNPEIRREIKTSSKFLDKIDYYFGEGFKGRPSSHEILIREILPYVFEAFIQYWDDLEWVLPDESRVRYYEFEGDEIPHAYFIGRLDMISANDQFYIVEEIVLIDLIVDFGEAPLEHPDDSTPNR